MQQKTDRVHAEDCWEDASSTKPSAKSKRLILQLQTVTLVNSAVTIYPIHVDQWFSIPVLRVAFGTKAPFVRPLAVFQ